MPLPIPDNSLETPIRRMITGVHFSVQPETGDNPAPIPTLTATVTFTDIYRNGEGLPVLYPVSGAVTLTNSELFAIPGAAQTLGAVQALAYSKASEQGL